MKFPIAKSIQHQLVDLKGQISFFYAIDAVDLEQKSSIELSSLTGALLSELNQLGSETFKLYRIDGKNYLNCKGERDHFGVFDLTPHDHGLNLFFGTDEFSSNLSVHEDFICLNTHYYRLLSASEFDDRQASLGSIPADLDYVLIFKRQNSDKSLSRLERIRTSHLSSFLKTKRDLSSESAYMGAEELMGDVLSGKESLFLMELYFLVSDLSLEALKEKTLSTIERLKACGIKVKIEGQNPLKFKSGLMHFYTSLIPGVFEALKYRVHETKSSHLLSLLPVHESKLFDEGVSFCDLGDHEIFFNPFDKSLKNRNILVSGTSGAGKSVFVNKLVHSLIEQHPTVILDKGGSYSKLSLYHGGKTLEHGINPMHFKNAPFLREFILSFAEAERFSKLDRARLFQKIVENLHLDNFWDLLSALEADFKNLRAYFYEFEHFIHNEKLENTSLVYADIESFPKSLITPVILYILEYFKNIPVSEKILVFDECWSFLKSHSDYIDECFRTFRKSGSLPIAISQSASDFEANSFGVYQAIVNNSYFQVYFPQETQDLNLSVEDCEQIQSLSFLKGQYSECLLKSSDHKYSKPLRIYLSKLEYELFHTESEQSSRLYQFIQNNQAYFKSVSECVDSFVRLTHA